MKGCSTLPAFDKLEIFPIGSIYTSINSTSPATLFGGTWTQIQGRFLLSASSSYAAGGTGGASTVDLSHVHSTTAISLTEAQLPHVSGYITMHSAETDSKGSHWWNPSGVFSGSPTHSTYCAPSSGTSGATSISGISFSMGSDQAHDHGNTSSNLSSSQSIMPPYLVVYMWQRTG